MSKVANLAEESTSTTGTGTMTLTAKTGYARFAQRFANGDLVHYTIEDGNNWEVGIGTVGASNTLARTTVQETFVAGVLSTSSPTAITLSGNNANVRCVASAQYLNDASNLSAGLVAPGLLGTGTPSADVVLYGDGVWRSLWNMNSQTFTSSGTFTWPSGVDTVYVTMIGGGGSGGGTTTAASTRSGGGGAGELILRYPFRKDVEGGGASSFAVTVGAGGAAISAAIGNAGGTSLFGILKALGGKGGAVCNSATAGVGGDGGGLSGGVGSALTTFVLGTWLGQFFLGGNTGSGGNGASANQPGNFTVGSPGAINFAMGGSTIFGLGGQMTSNTATVGTDAASTAYGAGGSGVFGSATARTGGAGAPGIVIVEWHP
jgi:hypothetical protein